MPNTNEQEATKNDVNTTEETTDLRLKEDGGEIVVPDEPGTPSEESGDAKKMPVSVLAGISFTLLKVKFMAGFEKDSDGFSILLLPTNQDENTGMTVKEMIADVKKLMNNSGAEIEGGAEKMETDITSAIEGVSDPENEKTEEEKKGFDPMKLRVCLRQAFLYYRKAGNEKTFEYAFKLEIDAKDMLPDIGLVALDNLSIAVWSTDRKKILEDMGLFHIDEMLEAYA